MKIWIDDVRHAPKGFVWCKSTNEAIWMIQKYYDDTDLILDSYDFPDAESWNRKIELIDIDHDAGEYAIDGGDYINVLNWLEKNQYNIPIRIHSMNPVGVQNMRAIIEHNGWREVY